MRSRSTGTKVPWATGARTGLAAAALLGSLSVAHAGMLDSEACRRIKSEHDKLNASGLREIMAKGPEWAKTNLTKERLEQARRFLALEEDVRFRCPLGKARPELEAAESEAGATTALQPNESEPAAKPLPAPGAKPARKTKQQSRETSGEQPAAQGSGGTAEAKAAAPNKAVAKKKTPGADAPSTQAKDVE